MYQVTEQLRLISFEISRNAKAKPPGQSLDDMLVYSKDYDSSADDRILNSLETHPQSPGLNHSKRSIGNVIIRPIQELFLFVEKTEMAVLKLG